MRLTDRGIRALAAGERPTRHADGGGLYVEVRPTGKKLWRYKYRVDGREKLLALGQYPDVSLREARERHVEARRVLASGRDPSVVVNDAAPPAADSFEAVAREWLDHRSGTWIESTRVQNRARLTKHVFPWLGLRPVAEVTAPDLLAVLRRAESSGAIETAHRLRALCGRILRFAVATGRAERDVAADLRGALAPVKAQHFASVTDPREVGALLRALDGYQGQFATRCALRLAPYVFARPGELRAAEWSEFDLDAAEWRIPAARMKMRRPHLVPLAVQALGILRDLHPLTGHGRYLFPGQRSADRPLSENTLNAALRRLGYEQGAMTAHGFRSLASTLLHEQGWPSEVIERQLAHADRDAVRAAYNYAEHLPERRRMMQAWADYLDGLRSGAKVVALRRRRSE